MRTCLISACANSASWCTFPGPPHTQLPGCACLSCSLFLSPPICCVVSAQPQITVQFRYRYSLAITVPFSSIFLENLSSHWFPDSLGSSDLINPYRASQELVCTSFTKQTLISWHAVDGWQFTALSFRWTSGESIYSTSSKAIIILPVESSHISRLWCIGSSFRAYFTKWIGTSSQELNEQTHSLFLTGQEAGSIPLMCQGNTLCRKCNLSRLCVENSSSRILLR